MLLNYVSCLFVLEMSGNVRKANALQVGLQAAVFPREAEPPSGRREDRRDNVDFWSGMLALGHEYAITV